MNAVPPNPALELHAGALRLALRPDLGGAIAGFWHDTTPVMRSCEPGDLKASRPSACFTMVPYYTARGSLLPRAGEGLGMRAPQALLQNHTRAFCTPDAPLRRL